MRTGCNMARAAPLRLTFSRRGCRGRCGHGLPVGVTIIGTGNSGFTSWASGTEMYDKSSGTGAREKSALLARLSIFIRAAGSHAKISLNRSPKIRKLRRQLASQMFPRWKSRGMLQQILESRIRFHSLHLVFAWVAKCPANSFNDTAQIHRFVPKGHLPANHAEENAAEAPDVGRYGDFLGSKNQFWCKVCVRMRTTLNLIEFSLVPVRRKTEPSFSKGSC